MKLSAAAKSLGAQKNFSAFAATVGSREEWKQREEDFNESWYQSAVARTIVFRTLERLVQGLRVALVLGGQPGQHLVPDGLLEDVDRGQHLAAGDGRPFHQQIGCPPVAGRGLAGADRRRPKPS